MDASHYFQSIALIKFLPIDDLIRATEYLRINSDIQRYSYGRSAFSAYLDALESKGFSTKAKSESEDSFRELLCRDMRTALRSMTAEDVLKADAEADFDLVIREVRELLAREFAKFDLTPPKCQISFVDEFPGPYAGRNYIAMALDEGDRADFGVEPGIVIKKSKYIPLFGRTIFLHEMIHIVLGERDPFELARGLEEGLCELLGFVYLGAKAIGSKEVRHSFAYVRLRQNQLPIWSYYTDMTRQARLVYRAFGLSGVFDMLKSGRKELKKVEASVLDGTLSQAGLQRGTFDPSLESDLDWLLDAFPSQCVVSPEAYKILPHMGLGASLREARVQSGLSEALFDAAVVELEGHLRILTIRGDHQTVIASDAANFKSPYSIRYKVPEIIGEN